MVRKKHRLRLAVTLCFALGLAILAALPVAALQSPGSTATMIMPSSAAAPADNPTTKERVELGKQLFFDPRLSGDNTVSCATCHLPDKAFADGLPKAKGAGGKPLLRNTPSLINVGFYPHYFWDGRAKSLEEQALFPLQSGEEMNQNLDELEIELSAIPGYVTQFRSVFGTPPIRSSIAKALAAFERTLISSNSPFDRHLAGDGKALSEEAKRGWELFRGDADCIRCHTGPTFSDGNFYRLGTTFTDKGRGAITDDKRAFFAFRTPGLRDVARTAPYFHDGSMATLTQVVEFYYRGVPTGSADGLPLDVTPLLGQSYSEIAAIVAFLESLTGEQPQVSRPALP
jgi:cytochrome c peroxidase